MLRAGFSSSGPTLAVPEMWEFSRRLCLRIRQPGIFGQIPLSLSTNSHISEDITSSEKGYDMRWRSKVILFFHFSFNVNLSWSISSIINVPKNYPKMKAMSPRLRYKQWHWALPHLWHATRICSYQAPTQLSIVACQSIDSKIYWMHSIA